MFTGLVEEIGTVSRVQTGASVCVLTVSAKTVLEDVHIGDSIAVNGACLTVCRTAGSSFSADVMPETMRRTNLGGLRPGSRVNLERAMPADGRFGGHLVSGHIDGTGTVRQLRQEGNAVWVTVAASPAVMRYIAEKGSVAVDGISLTVAAVTQQDFSVSVIPHTAAETTLLSRRPGDAVNLECDIIAKYTEKLLRQNAGGGLSAAFLAENGFL